MLKKVWIKLLSLAGKEELVEISTPRAGVLKKDMYVICNGFFCRLKKWSGECATIEHICYTAGTKATGFDRASKGSRIQVGLDNFRAATEEETAEYL